MRKVALYYQGGEKREGGASKRRQCLCYRPLVQVLRRRQSHPLPCLNTCSQVVNCDDYYDYSRIAPDVQFIGAGTNYRHPAPGTYK